MFDIIKEILISEKKNFTGSNYKRLPRTMVYIENNLKDSAISMYLTIDPLI